MMKKITMVLGLVLLFSMAAFSQQLKVKNDTSIVLIEGNNEMELDSLGLENKIKLVKKNIESVDAQLIKIEAAKANVLEQKSSFQSTLTYFLEIRNSYQKLKAAMIKKPRDEN